MDCPLTGPYGTLLRAGWDTFFGRTSEVRSMYGRNIAYETRDEVVKEFIQKGSKDVYDIDREACLGRVKARYHVKETFDETLASIRFGEDVPLVA